MMLLNLGCAECMIEQIKKGVPYNMEATPILTPFEPVNDTGLYNISCSKGHNSKASIDNIDFEILFEYAINAVADGYYRDAVSSFTSSMERFFEFFIKASLRESGLAFQDIDKIWSNISKQSERQLGAYIALYSKIFKFAPSLLSNNNIFFRNSVIHKGYIPQRNEAINYGDVILKIIEDPLVQFKNKFRKTTEETFCYYGYRNKAKKIIETLENESKKEINNLCVNILTTVNVMNGRDITPKDPRRGNIEARIQAILKDRGPRKLLLVKKGTAHLFAKKMGGE